MNTTKIAAPKIKRIDLQDAEALLQFQTSAQQVRGQIQILEQLVQVSELAGATALRLLAGPGPWKLSRDEGGYLLTQKEETNAAQIQNPA